MFICHMCIELIRYSGFCRFATQKLNGLLFYNGRLNELHDFMSLELVEGQVRFSFSTGNTTVYVESNSKDKLNDGHWHFVSLVYSNRVSVSCVQQHGKCLLCTATG